MLLSFTTQNYKSFNKPQTLKLETGKIRGKQEHVIKTKSRKLLRFLSIYGNNAAGKSNFLDAIQFSRSVILYGYEFTNINSYNRTSEGNQLLPSFFEYEVVIDNKVFNYCFGIILKVGKIVYERLSEVRSSGKCVVFLRDLEKGNYIITAHENDSSLEKAKLYFDDIKNLDDTLYLTEMNRNKKFNFVNNSVVSIIQLVHGWFRHVLTLISHEVELIHYSYFIDKDKFPEFVKVFNEFGLGITDIKMEDVGKDEIFQNIPPQMAAKLAKDIERLSVKAQKSDTNIEEHGMMLFNQSDFFLISADNEYNTKYQTIVFEHGKFGSYNISEESDGTRRLIELLEVLFSDNSNRVFIIDELDRSMHPLMTKKFVEFFLERTIGKSIQLIITTHESRLLDMKLLRRDEFWFVDKDSNGNSELLSLESKKERVDMKLDKAYLNGKYGAIPDFKLHCGEIE